MKLIIVFTVCVSTTIFAQSDWTKWTAKEIPYEIGTTDSEKQNTNDSVFLLSQIKNIYKFLISDLDGDNCPFYPSCSNFLITSVKETNLFKGMLMFADRFTRDMNFLKIGNHYPKYITGKLYDPPINYMLNQNKIKYIPGDETVAK